MASLRMLVLSLLFAACGAGPQWDAGVDAGVVDSGSADAGMDAGVREYRLEELARIGGDASLTTSFTFGCGAIADGSGGLYAALDTDSDLDGPLRGMRDLVIARFTGTGQVLWLRQLGDESLISPLFTRACALAVDGAGNVFAAGLVNGRGTFLGETLPALYTAMVASWTPDGTRRWVKLLGGAGGAEAMGLSVGNGEVRVLGYSNGMIGSVSGLGNGDVFLARLDSASGATRDLNLFGGADEDLPAGLTASALVFFTTTGVLGPVSAIVHVPLTSDGGFGTPTSLPEAPEHIASLGSELIAASTEKTDGGVLLRVRAFDPTGTETRARVTESPAGSSLRAFDCGRSGCLLAVREDAGTRLLAIDPSFAMQASVMLENADAGIVVRAVTALGDGFTVIGSVSAGSRAEAVLWRFAP